MGASQQPFLPITMGFQTQRPALGVFQGGRGGKGFLFPVITLLNSVENSGRSMLCHFWMRNYGRQTCPQTAKLSLSHFGRASLGLPGLTPWTCSNLSTRTMSPGGLVHSQIFLGLCVTWTPRRGLDEMSPGDQGDEHFSPKLLCGRKQPDRVTRGSMSSPEATLGRQQNSCHLLHPQPHPEPQKFSRASKFIFSKNNGLASSGPPQTSSWSPSPKVASASTQRTEPGASVA